MAWSYSGDPSTSELDMYRFEIGDTIEDEPLLQNEEITFILENNTNHYKRLYLLYSKLANIFSRDIKRKIGPLSEDPGYRATRFRELATKYEKMANSSSSPKSGTTSTSPAFTKGMHDNV